MDGLTPEEVKELESACSDVPTSVSQIIAKQEYPPPPGRASIPVLEWCAVDFVNKATSLYTCPCVVSPFLRGSLSHDTTGCASATVTLFPSFQDACSQTLAPRFPRMAQGWHHLFLAQPHRTTL